MKKAKETGKQVDVPGQTTETTKISATPQGEMRLETSPVPTRVKRDGSWHEVDLTLVKRPDGSIAPRMAPSDISFGGAGGDRLLTMARGGKSMTLTWPDGKLPTPALDGGSATYADAGGPGIDLVVQATPTGVATYVVVKTPEAANSPQLEKVDFGVQVDGLKLRERTGNALTVVDSAGEEIFNAPQPTMWEGDRPANQATSQSADPEQVAAGPPPGSQERPMDVEVSSDKLTVIPDQKLLKAPDARFPLVIDPSWQTWNGNREGDDNYGPNDAGWAYVDRTFPTSSYWKRGCRPDARLKTTPTSAPLSE